MPAALIIWFAGPISPIFGGQETRTFGVSRQDSDQQRAIRLFRTGKFEEAAELAKQIDTQLGKFSTDERWPLLEIRSRMQQGRYPEAFEALKLALERFPRSIRIRWEGARVLRYNDETKLALELENQLDQLYGRSSWRYRDVENQIVVARYKLSRNEDAKQVISTYLKPLRESNPGNASVYAAIAQLAFEKYDYAMAAENYLKAAELREDDPDILFGIAQSFRPSDFKRCRSALDAALEIDPLHVPSLLMIADQQIGNENYDEATEVLEKVLSVNPDHPNAWAYKSVLAHLANEPEKEAECRSRAMTHWAGNPEVDHLIGRELSEKYRFKESVAYQRRALVYDDDYLPAKFQLAHDLLRLGQELEGWKLADEVFDADQYNVVAHNLVTLRNELSKYRTLEGDGFVVRMESEESLIYGSRVMELLREAKKVLVEKYEVELETPIFIEIFPRQQDFAIRTFGLPGGDGFLGVCFGRLITMNSPAAQGANLTSWESVLWHEFCHVVTLQKTNNRMPRWLSEGISVYEEHQKNRAWGDSMNADYRQMMLGDELTPVSQLSSAFLNPASPLHLQFAYYESSLVVEYLIEEFGKPVLNKVLDELAIGTPINDALRRHAAPVNFLDRKFAEFAIAKANAFAPNANWDPPTLPEGATVDQWKQWNEENPGSVNGLLRLAIKYREDGKLTEALATLDEIFALDPAASMPAYMLSARIHRDQQNPQKEKLALQKLVSFNSDSVDALTRLLELTATEKSWEETKKYARQLIALNPLIPVAYRYLSVAAEETSDDPSLSESLSVLARLNPLDGADVHFRLASALFRQDQLAKAKRHVLIALEHAPRYRDAHRLLLQIRSKLSVNENPSESAIAEPISSTNANRSEEPK